MSLCVFMRVCVCVCVCMSKYDCSSGLVFAIYLVSGASILLYSVLSFQNNRAIYWYKGEVFRSSCKDAKLKINAVSLFGNPHPSLKEGSRVNLYKAWSPSWVSIFNDYFAYILDCTNALSTLVGIWTLFRFEPKNLHDKYYCMLQKH